MQHIHRALSLYWGGIFWEFKLLFLNLPKHFHSPLWVSPEKVPFILFPRWSQKSHAFVLYPLLTGLMPWTQHLEWTLYFVHCSWSMYQLGHLPFIDKGEKKDVPSCVACAKYSDTFIFDLLHIRFQVFNFYFSGKSCQKVTS